MNNVNRFIDHTNLSVIAKKEDIINLCKEAIQHEFRAVCVHSCWTDLCRDYLVGSQVQLAVVVDFPFGASLRCSRQSQIKSLGCKANEVDLVAPLHHIQAERWDDVYDDIYGIKKLCIECNMKLKTIIEVSLLTDEQIMRASEVCAQAGSDMIKTSTGIINTRSTNLNDIVLIRQGIQKCAELGQLVGIKASAGIKTYEQAWQFIEAGVSRIGTSSALSIIHENT